MYLYIHKYLYTRSFCLFHYDFRKFLPKSQWFFGCPKHNVFFYLSIYLLIYFQTIDFVFVFFLLCFTCLNSVRNTKSSIGRTLAETIRISPVRRQRGAWGKNCTTFICMSALWCNKYKKERRAVLTSDRAERDARRRCQRFTRFSDHVCGWCVQGVSFVNSTLERGEVWIKHCQI